MKLPVWIPVADPHAQFLAYEAEIRAAINRVLESGQYILGHEVDAFEREFATFVDSPFCVSVASGTDALALALKVCGVGPGDEVITVANSAVATIAAIEQIGACPVLVDIDPATRCMDPQKISPLVTSKTRAVLPVHLYGYPVAMPEICEIAKDHNLKVVEDCAQALGAFVDSSKVGTFGDAAAFSFYPTKNLAAMGDAGAVITPHEDLAQRLLQMRQYGWDRDRNSQLRGVNSRMDELQAAVLRVKLANLAPELTRRQDLARQFREAMSGDWLTPPPQPVNGKAAVHLFVIETNHRAEFQRFCEQAAIGTAIHYPVPVHRQPAYRNRLRGSDRLGQTEGLCERIISLPFYPHLAQSHVSRICEALHLWRPSR